MSMLALGAQAIEVRTLEARYQCRPDSGLQTTIDVTYEYFVVDGQEGEFQLTDAKMKVVY